MRLIKRTSAAVLAVIIVAINLAFLSVAADSDRPEDNPPKVERCVSYYLYNFENDVVLMESGMDTPVYPASTVKLMTGIVAIEHFGDDLDREITITSGMLKTVAGNNIKLAAGEVVSVKDMLYATLQGGANDAALVLAHSVAGSMEDFVGLMNEKAAELGAKDTHYTNPTGMHNDKMVTTTRDTVTIAKYAAAIPLLAEITATPKYVMEATNLKDFRTIYNRNFLISGYYNQTSTSYIYDKATGMNGGSTTAAGDVMVATAKSAEGDLTYLAVIMGAESDKKANYACKGIVSMFKWAFSAWGNVEVLSTDNIITEVPVSLSSVVDHVVLSPEKSCKVYLPTSIDKDTELEYSYTVDEEGLSAPVKKGDRAGTVTVVYNGEIVGASDLIATVDIERSELLYTFAQIEQFTKSPFFIATVISAIILTVAYVLVNARIKQRPGRFK